MESGDRASFLEDHIGVVTRRFHATSPLSADRSRVNDSALDSSVYRDLVAAMSNERRLLDRLLFRHAEISMLIAAGEHRFIGRAIDEALEVEDELGAAELVRAMTTAELESMSGELSIADLVAEAPADIALQLGRLADDMNRLLVEVDRYRKQASAWAGDRAERVGRAIAGFGAQTYSSESLGS
jgi:hypothetical protein